MSRYNQDDHYPTEAAVEQPPTDNQPTVLFEVTRIVGAVMSGGEVSPRVAAFMLIAEDGDGIFSFPLDGNVVSVKVEETKGA